MEERLIQLLSGDQPSELASRTRRHLANRIGELIVMVVEGDVQLSVPAERARDHR